MSRIVRCAVMVLLALAGLTTAANATANQPEGVIVVVELAGTSAVDAFEAARAAGLSISDAKKAAVRARNLTNTHADRLVDTLRTAGVQVEEFGRTYNAIPTMTLRMFPVSWEWLARLPGVKHVRGVGEPVEPQLGAVLHTPVS